MIYKILKCCVAVFILLLAACTATEPVKNQLTINALIIENHSFSELNDVKIKVEKTGAYASCGLVLRGRACSTKFQTKVYRGNPIFISWEHHGDTHKLGPIYILQPERIKTGVDAAVVIDFVSADDVTAQFRY